MRPCVSLQCVCSTHSPLLPAFATGINEGVSLAHIVLCIGYTAFSSCRRPSGVVAERGRERDVFRRIHPSPVGVVAGRRRYPRTEDEASRFIHTHVCHELCTPRPPRRLLLTDTAAPAPLPPCDAFRSLSQVRPLPEPQDARTAAHSPTCAARARFRRSLSLSHCRAFVCMPGALPQFCDLQRQQHEAVWPSTRARLGQRRRPRAPSRSSWPWQLVRCGYERAIRDPGG